MPIGGVRDCHHGEIYSNAEGAVVGGSGSINHVDTTNCGDGGKQKILPLTVTNSTYESDGTTGHTDGARLRKPLSLPAGGSKPGGRDELAAASYPKRESEHQVLQQHIQLFSDEHVNSENDDKPIPTNAVVYKDCNSQRFYGPLPPRRQLSPDVLKELVDAIKQVVDQRGENTTKSDDSGMASSLESDSILDGTEAVRPLTPKIIKLWFPNRYGVFSI